MPQNVIEVFEFPATSNHSSFCLIYVTLLRAYWYMLMWMLVILNKLLNMPQNVIKVLSFLPQVITVPSA